MPVGTSTQYAPAAAVGDPAQLLDVQVDRVAGDRVFVPDRHHPHRFTGDVQVAEPGDATAHQDPAESGRCEFDAEQFEIGDQHRCPDFHAAA